MVVHGWASNVWILTGNISAHFSSILSDAAKVVNDVDPQTISLVVTFFFVIMLVAILGTMGFGIYRRGAAAMAC